MARIRTDACVLVGFAALAVAVFSTILFSGKFLTSGDGITQSLPTFFGRTPLWEPNLLLGYPLFADPNQAFWYPLLRLCRAIPNGFNVYSVSPFVIVAFGTYGFARSVSGSIAGAIVAGVTVAFGGFMISHQGHVMLTHPAAFAPYVLWAIAELRSRVRASVIVAGAIALALGISSGTQQPLLYMCVVAVAYAIVFRPTVDRERTRFFFGVLMLFGIGIGLSAIALVPETEFALRSTRHHLTLTDFVYNSNGIGEFFTRALFPYFFGTTTAPWFPGSTVQVGAFTETTNYAGIVPLVLAAFSLFDRSRRAQAWFWIGVALWAAWMSMGNALFAARLAHAIPIYDLFRIPGRHAIEFDFAIAVLAALGVAALEGARLSWRQIALPLGASVAAFVAIVFVVARFGNDIRTATDASLEIVATATTLLPTTNATIGIPCCIFAIGCVVVAIAARAGNRRVASVLSVIAVVCDMTFFASASYWRDSPATVATLKPSAQATNIAYLLASHGGRMIAPPGSLVPPNLSTLWSLPDAAGYASLEEPEIDNLLHVNILGVLAESALGVPGDVGPDLAGVRVLVLPKRTYVPQSADGALATPSLDGFVGGSAIAKNDSVLFALPSPQHGSEVVLVSALGVSASIPNGSHVADLTVVGERDRHVFPILAGRDTSESAFDRPDILPTMRHARATIFAGPPDAHQYIARFKLASSARVREISIRWTYGDPAVGALTVIHAALVDPLKNVGYAFDARSRLDADSTHWRTAASTPSDETIVENVRAFPHAWIVGRDVVLPRPDQLRRISHGDGANSEPFDARQVALTEEPVSLGNDESGTVATTENEPMSQAYDVRCRAACMLATNDLWYPGWTAAIDGSNARLLEVDYAFRGVVVPAGTHRVSIRFAPTSLRIGIVLTLLACIVAGALFVPSVRRFLTE